jgi:hypothetical protein
MSRDVQETSSSKWRLEARSSCSRLLAIEVNVDIDRPTG